MTYHIILLLLLSLLSLAASAQSLTAKTTDAGLLVKEGKDSVLFYQQKTNSLDGAYPRADYIHPLYGLDGAVLTEDFPEDHLHHRGIFWAWHQVLIGDKPIGDAWECKNFVWDVQSVEHRQKDDGVLVLEAQTFWQSPVWTDANGKQEPFVSEETILTIHPKANRYRVIDIEISLLALVPELKIGGSEDEKGYGGFSVRMKLPEDIQFTSTAGRVTPTTNAVSAGPWMAISGSLAADGGKAGVVIMEHPNNPRPKDQWILREARSMQNPVYPGRNPVAVSDQEPTVLRYRLVVYQGDLSEEEIDGLYEEQD